VKMCDVPGSPELPVPLNRWGLLAEASPWAGSYLLVARAAPDWWRKLHSETPAS